MTKIEDLKRRVEAAVKKERVHTLLLIDRDGEIWEVGTGAGQSVERTMYRLLDAARANFHPYFEICTVIDGLVQNKGGDAISIDDLPTALADAEAERVRFYSEREKEYGDSAWPVSYA